ncbi:hypothetical protein EG68_10411 [Paragonimus skrjabini miyazakii]|uniref:Paramyosin n=1 Tax=Paragonimus skrjabini miyazakii TaxID=59628 RepID=A0A8S9YGF1_9TREM|nr:hypothetical protein EG68_10411 [Paragonimus skrjabini miyazakii]
MGMSLNTAQEDKKRLEARLVGFEDQLEEAQNGMDAAEERYKRCLSQLEQVQTELSTERSNAMRIDSQRVSLEKQVKELRDRLVEAEKDGGRRSKAQLTTLEARLTALDEQLEIEKGEKMTAIKNCRRLEKRMKEFAIQVCEVSRFTLYFPIKTPLSALGQTSEVSQAYFYFLIILRCDYRFFAVSLLSYFKTFRPSN